MGKTRHERAAAATWHRIIIPEARPSSDVPYHSDSAPGQKYLVLADSVVPGSPMYVAARRVNVIPPEPPRWLDPHEHHCNSFYLFIGDEVGLGGLHATAIIGDLTLPVASPAAVLIPPYALHHYWMTGGSGWYFQITLWPEYVSSLVPPDEMGRHSPRALTHDAVYQEARRMTGKWSLINRGAFADPGVTVEVADLNAPVLPALSRDSGVMCLDVALGRQGAEPSIEYHVEGEATEVKSPMAVLHYGECPALRDRTKSGGLVVRIVPDARPSSDDLERRSGGLQ